MCTITYHLLYHLHKRKTYFNQIHKTIISKSEQLGQFNNLLLLVILNVFRIESPASLVPLRNPKQIYSDQVKIQQKMSMDVYW